MCRSAFLRPGTFLTQSSVQDHWQSPVPCRLTLASEPNMRVWIYTSFLRAMNFQTVERRPSGVLTANRSSRTKLAPLSRLCRSARWNSRAVSAKTVTGLGRSIREKPVLRPPARRTWPRFSQFDNRWDDSAAHGSKPKNGQRAGQEPERLGHQGQQSARHRRHSPRLSLCALRFA